MGTWSAWIPKSVFLYAGVYGVYAGVADTKTLKTRIPGIFIFNPGFSILCLPVSLIDNLARIISIIFHNF